MKPTTTKLCLAFLCCSAVAVWAFKQSVQSAADDLPEGSPSRSKSASARQRSQPKTATNTFQSLSSRQGEMNHLTASQAAAVPVPHRRVLGHPNTVTAVSETEWRRHAELAENQANRELRRLAMLLDLDPVQQDLVFPSLVRQSSSWLPGMTAETIAGGSIAPSSGDYSSVLNDDQQQTLADTELDRQEWWQEMLPKLLPPEVASPSTDDTSAASPTPSGADSPAVSKEFEGGEFLIEE